MTMKRILLLFLLFCGGYVHAQELDSVRIYYRQGHREVDVLFRDNRAELERFIRILREEYGANRLESVVVRSWSSPEGVNHLNEVLSDRRADSLKTYLVRHAEIPDNLVCIHGEGIAWDMLRRMVAASDMLYKKEVLHILDHTPVWVFDKAGRVVDGRKKQLMDLRGGMPYTYMLENFFPDLRSSLSVVCYRKPEPPVKVIPQKESEVKEPEQQPQPGHAWRSTCSIRSSLTDVSADSIIASIKSRWRPSSSPASIGPPDTNTVGIFNRMEAISIPGVILSQLLMQTIASALWAFTIYSTLSAIMSREGSE